jgi:hypothetical protein
VVTGAEVEGTGAAVLVTFRGVVRALLRSVRRVADDREVPEVLGRLGEARNEARNEDQDGGLCKQVTHDRPVYTPSLTPQPPK